MKAAGIFLGLHLVFCLAAMAADITVDSPKGNSIKVTAEKTINHPDSDKTDVLLVTEWPTTITATVTPTPVSDWKWISNTPDPTSKEFDGDPATELKIESLFETLARRPDGTADDSETITATISMPKIDLSITNPDNEEIGKDKFDTGGGIIVLLPEGSAEDPIFSKIIIQKISPDSLGGNYTFEWDSQMMDLYESDKETPVGKDKNYPAAQEHTFYAKPKKESSKEDDLDLKVSWTSEDGKTTIKDADILSITAVKVELTLYSPGKKSTPGAAIERPTEEDQEYAGILIANNDDDDKRSTPEKPAQDNDDTKLGDSDNDIVQVELEFLPTGLGNGTLEVVLPTEKIRAFDKDGKELKSSDLTIDLKSPQGPLADLKKKMLPIFLEGKEAHTAAETLKFTYKRKDTIREDKGTLLPVDLKYAFKDAPASDGDYKSFKDPQRFLMGQHAYFKCFIPPDVLPSSKPAWKGTFGLVGNGLTADTGYSTGSASAYDTDFKTVIADFSPSEITENIIACRYVVGIHSNAAPGSGFTSGHAWVSITDWNSGSPIITTYGLWPDKHPNSVDNGPGSDVRINQEPAQTGSYNRYFLLIPSEHDSFISYRDQTAAWTYFNTCANWAEGAFDAASGENVSSKDLVLFGTPRKIAESIEALEATLSTEPTAPKESDIEPDRPSSSPSTWDGSSFTD